MNYDTEFTGALQAIAENVSESEFDTIIEGAALLMEENDVAMDEAVSIAAAMLYNEGAIGDNTYAVAAGVLDEFANSIPATYTDVINVLAENMTQDQFDAFMSEAVSNQLAIMDENKVGDAFKKVGSGIKAAPGKAWSGIKTGSGKVVGGVKAVPGAIKAHPGKTAAIVGGTALVGGAAYGGKKLYDRIQEKKKEEKKLGNRIKKAIQHESADYMSLADLRGMV